MIIDFHTHTFPDKIAPAAIQKLKEASHTTAFTTGTEAELIASMKKCGIAKSVVLPIATNLEKIVHINDISAEKNKGGELIYFGCIHPDYENFRDELKRIKSIGIKGIKLHPFYQNTDFDDIKYKRLLDCAEELRLITVVHSGLDVGFPGIERCTPEMMKNVIDEVRPERLVLAHMGGWRCWEESAELLSGKGVFIDTSFSVGKMSQDENYYPEEDLKLLSYENAAKIISAYGEDHVLFGTDSPWSEQKASIDEIMMLPVSAEAKEKILHRNAESILGLS